MSDSEDNGSRRISVDLPNQLIERFDELKREWGLRGRGAVLKKLLEVILTEEGDKNHKPFTSSDISGRID